MVERKSVKNNSGVQIWAKRTKIGSKTSFFCHIFKFDWLVFLEIAYNDNLEQCITSGWGKSHQENFWGTILG